MGRTACATLATDHLVHNWLSLRRKAPKSHMWAMVKANAYGHGIRSVSQRLMPYLRPFDALGVASTDEALALRKVGVNNLIVLVEGVFEPSELEVAAIHNFVVVFHSQRQISWLKQCPPASTIAAWLKVNTGMARLGVAMKDALSSWGELSSSPSICGPVGIMSHLACADEKDHPLNQSQLQSFDTFRSLNVPLSLCNSPGLIHFPSHHYDVVRPGISLYGVSPINDMCASDLDLKPVMTLRTNLIAMHQLSKGDGVGYGRAFVCPEDMPVGVAAMGYGDGYPRLSSGAPVMINGAICHVIGRVSMDMMTIDLRPCLMQGKNVQEGDEVLLWGQNALGHLLPVEKVACASHRSSNDLLTGVQHRVRFIWV